MAAGPTTRPAPERFGKLFGLAFSGAVFGCLAIGLVSGFMGVWPLFFAFPLFAGHLVFSTLLAAAATATSSRLWRWPSSTIVTMAAAAVLTFLLFAALPLYFTLLAPGRDGGLLFN